MAVSIGDWLHDQGLGQYGKVFRESAIDLDVLFDLTDDDLRQIGVPLGDRKRLLKAIASFSPAGAPKQSTPHAPPVRETPATTTSAERRPVTVLFCDLVGSTALAAKLDAEDWRDLVGAYLDAASAGRWRDLAGMS